MNFHSLSYLYVLVVVSCVRGEVCICADYSAIDFDVCMFKTYKRCFEVLSQRFEDSLDVFFWFKLFVVVSTTFCSELSRIHVDEKNF